MNIHITNRMRTIVDMMPICGTAADIGADHALLSIHLIQRGRAKRVYACDIREAPLIKAKENIRKFHMEDKIVPCLSDGLSEVYDKAEAAMIAGMGGELIKRILFAEPRFHIHTFVFQAMSRSDVLRRSLPPLGLAITEERLVQDGNRIYCVIRAERGKAAYSDVECCVGPCLLKTRGKLFLPYLRRLIAYETQKVKGSDESMRHAQTLQALQEIEKEETHDYGV